MLKIYAFHLASNKLKKKNISKYPISLHQQSGNVVMKKQAAEAKMKQLQQLQQQQLRKQEIQQQLATQDMSTVLVQLVARSIRIGSFRGQPSDAFKLTVQGVQFTIQCELRKPVDWNRQ